MNTQEQNQLTRFLQQLKEAHVGTKDPEAEQLIQETCRQQADANYLLVQRSMLLGEALATAQTEITRLQRELESSRGSTNSFLGGNAWGNTSSTLSAPPPRPANSAYTAQITPPIANASSWGSGLLGTVATTAAGVVAGSFLFQGIEHLMGNHNNSNNFLSDNKGSHDPVVAPTEHLAANDFADLGPDESSDPDWM